jgi:hypothetical protein
MLGMFFLSRSISLVSTSSSITECRSAPLATSRAFSRQTARSALENIPMTRRTKRRDPIENEIELALRR